MNKLFIKDLTLKDKKVLVRVDFNVPLSPEGKVENDARIQASLPTISHIIEQGGIVILMSHLGRPKGKKISSMSLAPAAKRLEELLGKNVFMAEDCVGEAVESMVQSGKPGDVILLENLRFYKEEEANDNNFAQQLSAYGDFYINDAFGTAHRPHASTEGVTHFIEHCACGFLMKKELDYLGTALTNYASPFVAIIGGAKISGKIDVVENLLPKVDSLLVAGGIAHTLYKAKGCSIGKSLCEDDKLQLAEQLLDMGEDKLKLPVDFKITNELHFEKRSIGDMKVVTADKIPDGWESIDIGPETVTFYSNIIKNAKTIVWNGPLGVFEIEKAAAGTMAIAQALADATSENGAVSIVGGGDSASAIKTAGVADKVSHISTGGGASLEFLEGKELPGVSALTDAGVAV